MRLTSRPVRSTLPVNLITDGRVALVVGGGRVGLRKAKSLLAANLSVVLISPTALPDFFQLGTAPKIPGTSPSPTPPTQNSEAVPNLNTLKTGTAPDKSPSLSEAVPKNHSQNTVAGPQTSGTALEKSGAVPRFRWIEKAYDGEVLEGGWLAIFACTDDKIVNLRILDDARKAKIPCCLADGNWAEGDFTMPAVLRDDDIVFSVSTNGQNCRTSRDIRDSISKWVKSRKSKRSVAVIGLSGQELGDINLSQVQKGNLHAILSQFKDVEGWLILNTCSRVEICVVGAISDRLIETLIVLFKAFSGCGKLCDIKSYIANEAFRHLALVVSGLDSPFVGEYAIAGQFKDALDESSREGGMSPFLSKFTSLVQQCSKEIRAKSADLLNIPLEIEDIAYNYIETSGYPLAESRVAVLGTGSVGTGIAKLLSSKNKAFTWVYHNLPPANDILDDMRKSIPDSRQEIVICPWDSLHSAIAQSDIIISALTLDKPIIWGQPLNKSQQPQGNPNQWGQPLEIPVNSLRFGEENRGQPLKRRKLIVDLGQPANFQIPGDYANDIEIVTLGMLKDMNRQRHKGAVVDKVIKSALDTIAEYNIRFAHNICYVN